MMNYWTFSLLSRYAITQPNDRIEKEAHLLSKKALGELHLQAPVSDFGNESKN